MNSTGTFRQPLVLVATLGLLAQPAPVESAASIQNIDATAEPLRGHFNAAAGKVRALFLASPT